MLRSIRTRNPSWAISLRECEDENISPLMYDHGNMQMTDDESYEVLRFAGGAIQIENGETADHWQRDRTSNRKKKSLKTGCDRSFSRD